jgi:hypothetical protein
MLNSRLLFSLLALLSVGACGAGEDPQPASQAERDAALRDSAFGGLVEPMERAQAIQQLQIDRKQELDAAIEN